MRVVQILVNDLVKEAAVTLSPDHEYEIWSPYDSPDTARQLLNLLGKDTPSKSG